MQIKRGYLYIYIYKPKISINTHFVPFNYKINSLNLSYLMTDEYDKMRDYIAKLGNEVGANFVHDKDIFKSDVFRYRILIREKK